MSLAAHQLDAFFAVAQTSSFSRAAKQLHVTQPALSQRVHGLEVELKQRLFLRGSQGVRLTEAGLRLLRYCQAQRALEAELIAELAEVQGETLGGTVRVAGFSSIVRSAIIPALAPVCRAHPRVRFEIASRELGELVPMLERGETEFVVVDKPIERPGLEHYHLGYEELVLIESAAHPGRDDVYLDHDADDTTTATFLAKNGKRARKLARSFFDDIYGLLDGVAHGYGRGVVSRHLLDGSRALRVVDGYKPLRVAVVLHHYRQPAYSKLHDTVRRVLALEVARVLDAETPRPAPRRPRSAAP